MEGNPKKLAKNTNLKFRSIFNQVASTTTLRLLMIRLYQTFPQLASQKVFLVLPYMSKYINLQMKEIEDKQIENKGNSVQLE